MILLPQHVLPCFRILLKAIFYNIVYTITDDFVMYGTDTLKFAFLFHTTASHSTDTTQVIISSHLLGVRWLDWSLDENTDIVLSLDSNSQQGNFHLTYLFYKAFVKVPSFNSCHWPVSLCKARNQHLKKHVFTKIWHLTINVLLLSALRQEPE